MEEKDKVKYKFELVSDVIDSSVLSNTDLISDIHYTHTNPANIESIDVIKVNSIITKVREKKVYNLKPHRIIVKQTDDNNIVISDEVEIETIMSNKKVCDEISETINTLFIESLNDNCNVENVQYFDKGLFKIFSKKDPNKILNKITDCNWIITSSKMIDEISKSDIFKAVEPFKFFIQQAGKRLTLAGKVDHIYIYITDSIKDNEIFIGKLDSITSVFNRNLEVNIFDGGEFYKEGLEITIEYLFKNNGIRKIIVE